MKNLTETITHFIEQCNYVITRNILRVFRLLIIARNNFCTEKKNILYTVLKKNESRNLKIHTHLHQKMKMYKSM